MALPDPHITSGRRPSSRSAPPPASSWFISFSHKTLALCFSAVVPVHPTAFCHSPALDISQRQSLASPLCPQWMKQSKMQILRTLTGCWLLSAQQMPLWKMKAKAIPGCVKAFIPLKTTCCEDALSLGMENYGLMNHKRAS